MLRSIEKDIAVVLWLALDLGLDIALLVLASTEAVLRPGLAGRGNLCALGLQLFLLVTTLSVGDSLGGGGPLALWGLRWGSLDLAIDLCLRRSLLCGSGRLLGATGSRRRSIAALERDLEAAVPLGDGALGATARLSNGIPVVASLREVSVSVSQSFVE